jgi:hypothetical protein
MPHTTYSHGPMTERIQRPENRFRERGGSKSKPRTPQTASPLGLSVVQSLRPTLFERARLDRFRSTLVEQNKKRIVPAQRLGSMSVTLIERTEIDGWVAGSRKNTHRRADSIRELYTSMEEELGRHLRVAVSPEGSVKRDQKRQAELQPRRLPDRAIEGIGASLIRPQTEFDEDTIMFDIEEDEPEDDTEQFSPGLSVYMVGQELVPLPDAQDYGLDLSSNVALRNHRIGGMTFLENKFGLKIPDDDYDKQPGVFPLVHIKDGLGFNTLRRTDGCNPADTPVSLSFGNPRTARL